MKILRKFWNNEDRKALVDAYQKKPFGVPNIDWADEYSRGTRFSSAAVKAEMQKLKNSGIIKDSIPRILLFDIETLPLEVYVWRLKDNHYISPENIIKDWCVSCWSAKWLYEPEIFCEVLRPTEATKRDDERILKPLWKLLDRADIVIAQNGMSFDIRRVNARFVFYGMDEPMPYRVIDTYRASKQKFDFSSFKLDYMNKYLGLNGKVEMHMDDFIRCAQGDQEALNKMLEYNKTDVYILEEFYSRIRKWINHPNMTTWASRIVELEDDEEMCPLCREVVNDSRMTGTWVSPAGYRYKAWRCPHCGAIGRKTDRVEGQKIFAKKV